MIFKSSKVIDLILNEFCIKIKILKMPQKNIWDFYSICKKKLDRLHAKKLNQNKNLNPTNKSDEENLKNGKSKVQKKKKIPKDKSLDNEQSKSSKTNLTKLQPKIAIDNETRQIILKSNTIIDQTKSPIKSSCSFSDDFVFKKPQSPAPKARKICHENLNVSLNQKSFSDFKMKRNLDENLSSSDLKRLKQDSKSSINLDQRLNNDENINEISELSSSSFADENESKVRKRLFDLDDIKVKLQTESTDEFLNKLKDFQQKTSISNRFNISFYSPSKRAKEQERTIKNKEQSINCSINCSPKKYLESRIKSLSPSKSTNLMTENSPPTSLNASFQNLSPQKSLTNSLNSSQNLSFSSFNSSPQKSTAFNLSTLKMTSPFKSPIKVKNDLSLPDKYLELARVFNSLDVVVSQLFNRSELCTFVKVKQDVQKLTKKEFDLKQLAQIVTIFPNAYTFNYIITEPKESSDYELVIRPNILSNKMIQFTIQIRSNEFKDRLHSFTRRAHNDYLLSLDRPIVLNDLKLKRWHPNFKFPNIPESKLPERPVSISPKKQASIDDDIEVIFDSEEDEIESHE